MNGLLVFLFSGNFNSKLDYYGFFFCKEMYGRFAGPKKVAVITRWP